MDKYVSIRESPLVLSEDAIPLCITGLFSTLPKLRSSLWGGLLRKQMRNFLDDGDGDDDVSAFPWVGIDLFLYGWTFYLGGKNGSNIRILYTRKTMDFN